MKVGYKDLGVMPYAECWKLQQQLFDERLAIHRAEGGSSTERCGTILTVEHKPVYTLGKSGDAANLLVARDYLQQLGAEFIESDRGGDITFHGPGQIVCYPILDLNVIGIGLRRYIEALEEAVIRTIAHYGIVGRRLAGATGVWVEHSSAEGIARLEKICAIGVRASHAVTMHGLALNVATDLKWFHLINPCGFVDKGVTSIEKECGRKVDVAEVRQRLVEALARELQCDVIEEQLDMEETKN